MKRENIYLLLLAVALFFLWDAKCSGNGTEITLKTKEVKGAFRIDTVTVHDTIKLPTVTYRNGKTIYKTVIDSIDYAIIAKATKLVDSFKKQNDSIKLAMFISRSTPMDFKKTFENDTIKINMFGKYSGELYGIGMDYTIKPQTINATLKQYTVFLGLNTVSNQSFSNTSILPTISYLNANGLLISGGKDLLSSDGYMVGVSKSVWSKSRVKGK